MSPGNHNDGADMSVEALTRRDIIDILIGDDEVEAEYGIELHMKYLSGPMIQKMLQEIDPMVELEQGLSRWMMMQQLITTAIKKEKLDSLFTRMYAMIPYDGIRVSGKPEERKLFAVSRITNDLNTKLEYDDVKIEVTKKGVHVQYDRESKTIRLEDIETIDKKWFDRMSLKINDDLDSGRYDDAILKSRTLLEKVMLELLKKKGIEKDYKGNILEMYNDVRTQYDLDGNEETPHPVANISKAMATVVSNIAYIRNEYTDAHARTRIHADISKAEARFTVNASVSVCQYLIDIFKDGSLPKRTHRLF